MKALKSFYVTIKSELFWQTVFLLSPFIFLACILPFCNSIPRAKLGLSFQIFTIVPLILPIWEKAHRSVWQFDWYVMHLGNWFNHRGWQSITGWVRHYNHRLSQFIVVYIMCIAVIFYVVGLLIQMFALDY
jgi:hypothetical protein